MADPLLHRDATVSCVHQGRAQPGSASTRVKVGGKPVVTMPVTYTVSACANPAQAGGPCATALFSGPARRVRAGQMPVVLSTSSSTCAPTGTKLLVTVVQNRVRGT
jgi:hypothetical protein